MEESQPTSLEDEFQFSTQETKKENPFSVALLFYVMSAMAMLLACMRTATIDTANPSWAYSLIFVTSIAIGVVGSFFLALVFTRAVDIPVWGLMGFAVGAGAGILALVKAESYVEIMLIAFVGCWGQIAFNCLAARFR